ncbi:MAG: septum formation initiator family protein [Prevotellaceae bacterium]|nr:septum formation initiator family protein [Candidatus Faecinaster equi]
MSKRLLITGKFIVKHKYLFIILFFVLVIGIFDNYCLIKRYQNQKEIEQLKTIRDKYRKEYQHNKELMDQLESSPKSMERIARERYYMKRDNEDIFIIEE